MATEIRITDHGHDRGWERLRLRGEAFMKAARIAYESGIPHSGMKGNLHKWVSSMTREHGKKGASPRIFGTHLWVFADDGGGVALITVFPVPRNLLALCRELQQRKSDISDGH